MIHIHFIEHTPCLDKFLYHHLQDKETERYNELYFPHKLKSTYALIFEIKFSCLTSPIVEMHTLDFNSQVELNSFYLLIFSSCRKNFIHRRGNRDQSMLSVEVLDIFQPLLSTENRLLIVSPFREGRNAVVSKVQILTLLDSTYFRFTM